MSEQPKTIGREELYQKLWNVPIVRLAQELGCLYPELPTNRVAGVVRSWRGYFGLTFTQRRGTWLG